MSKHKMVFVNNITKGVLETHIEKSRTESIFSFD